MPAIIEKHFVVNQNLCAAAGASAADTLSRRPAATLAICTFEL